MPKFIDFNNYHGRMFINVEDIVRYWDVGTKKFGDEVKHATAMTIRGQDETLFIPTSANEVANKIYFATKGKNP